MARAAARARAHARSDAGEQSRRVASALLERSLFASDVQRLDAAAAAIGDASPDARTLDHLVAALKTPGYSEELSDEEASAHLAFWRRLAERDPADPVLQAHLADVELSLGDAAAGVRRILDAFDARPELFYEFGWDLEEDARSLGGDLLFRWQVHHLRWFLVAAGEHVESGEEAREIYGALIDEYESEEARLAVLRPIGEEIQRLEAAGDLPRAMVVRRRRRPRGEAEG
jgi:hypothetical protein